MLLAKRYPTLVIVAIHLLLLAVLTSALYAFGIINFLPGNDNLMHLDVYWYDKIRREGYSYSTTTTSSVAFFPLLPYFWRATRLSMMGMSVLNFGIFLAAFSWLAHHLRLPARWSLLLLSTPVLVFMAIPYTEALFFLFGTCLLLGLHRGRMSWWVIGLLGCGLTRTASIMFVPVLLFTTLLWAAQPGQARRALRWGGIGMLANVASVGVVAYMQWYQVGDALAFTKVQKFWNNHLRWPDYPFVTPAGIDMLWLDALALCLGCGAVGVCSWLAFRWLKQRRRPLPLVPPMVLFAVAYYALLALYIVSHQGGSVWNLSRYMLASPFFIVLVWYVGNRPAWPWQYYAYLLVPALAVWQLFGAFTIEFDNFTLGQSAWYFGLLSAYLFAYLMLRQLPWRREIIVLLYVFNLVMQLHLMDSLLQGYVIQ
ncbi:MAG: hypothetical protein JWR44_2592 [Hymenobacter sp.]|jgi:hypothetical protein|nr:hypothetical protein [Hymenobacter sp.]